MIIIIPDKCSIINLVVNSLVYLRIAASARTTLLFEGIKINFLLVKYRCGCICGCGNNFGILQMKILIFIISNKSEIVSPGAKTLRTEINYYFINKIFCFINTFCRYASYSNIEIISNDY